MTTSKILKKWPADQTVFTPKSHIPNKQRKLDVYKRQVTACTRSAQKYYRKGGIKLTVAKIIEWLDISPQEQQQLQTLIGSAEKSRRSCARKKSARRNKNGPVSYTHLDVYKRQEQGQVITFDMEDAPKIGAIVARYFEKGYSESIGGIHSGTPTGDSSHLAGTLFLLILSGIGILLLKRRSHK